MIEFEWAKKRAEGIGQSLYYSEITGKKPAIAIIMTSPNYERDILLNVLKKVDKDIIIFKIKAYE